MRGTETKTEQTQTQTQRKRGMETDKTETKKKREWGAALVQSDTFHFCNMCCFEVILLPSPNSHFIPTHTHTAPPETPKTPASGQEDVVSADSEGPPPKTDL